MNDLKALSVRQPWAWAIVYAGKNVENRTWRTSHRGPLLIHASKTFDAEGYDDLLYAERFEPGIFGRPLPSPSEFLRGGLVGRVDVVGCIGGPDDFDWADAAAAEAADFWFSGPFGLVLEGPEPMRFRPCRGMPGLFRPGVAAL